MWISLCLLQAPAACPVSERSPLCLGSRVRAARLRLSQQCERVQRRAAWPRHCALRHRQRLGLRRMTQQRLKTGKFGPVIKWIKKNWKTDGVGSGHFGLCRCSSNGEKHAVFFKRFSGQTRSFFHLPFAWSFVNISGRLWKSTRRMNCIETPFYLFSAPVPPAKRTVWVLYLSDNRGSQKHL